MKKSELILLSILLSLPLAGCEKNNDATPNTVLEEGSGQNNSDDSQERAIKLELVKKLEGSKVIPLSENRIFVVNDEHSTIYDENFNVVKDVGNVTISRSNAKDYIGMFKYKVPYFHDGEMKYKEGLMDLDGNILYEAKLLGSSDEDEMRLFIQSEGGYGYENNIGYRVTESGKIELSRLQTYRDVESGESVIKSSDVLFEGEYDEIMTNGTGIVGEYRGVSLNTDSGINSVAFKKDDYWGIVGFDGNVILEPAYGEIVFSHHNSNDGLDYYKVTNESGKVGIFNTNGWVIEPTFSHTYPISITGSTTVVYEQYGSGKTKVYNKEGELLKEFDYRAGVEALSNLSNSDMKSDEFFGVLDWSEPNKGAILFDSNFNEITLAEEIPNKYNGFSFVNDEVILVGNHFNNDMIYYLIDTKGNLITQLKSKDYEKIHWLNDKYLVDNKSVYELIVE